MGKWGLVITLSLWVTVATAAINDQDNEVSCKNFLTCPDYAKGDDGEKEQYVPVLADEPPVKERPVKREIEAGLILEEGTETVIDPKPHFTPTNEEITEDLK